MLNLKADSHTSDVVVSLIDTWIDCQNRRCSSCSPALKPAVHSLNRMKTSLWNQRLKCAFESQICSWIAKKQVDPGSSSTEVKKKQKKTAFLLSNSSNKLPPWLLTVYIPAPFRGPRSLDSIRFTLFRESDPVFCDFRGRRIALSLFDDEKGR